MSVYYVDKCVAESLTLWSTFSFCLWLSKWIRPIWDL